MLSLAYFLDCIDQRSDGTLDASEFTNFVVLPYFSAERGSVVTFKVVW